MNTPGVLIILLVLALVIIAGNTMIAVAFLRGRKDHFKGTRAKTDEAMDELHQRVEELSKKKD